MPVFVKTPSTSSLNEWAIIELQGDLEVRSNEIMSNQYIGDLLYTKFGQPVLIIGHHILQGREQELSKPFAVLEKSKTDEGERLFGETTLDSCSQDSTVDRTLLDNTVAIENKEPQSTEYIVKAICTKKIIFKARPKPIIANLAKKN